jgi:predicted O-methyltransferase YrrM
MWFLQQIRSFLMYLVRAKTPAQMHSPFLYALLTDIHTGKPRNPLFAQIEQSRASLLANLDTVSDVDHGAGSRSGIKKKSRTVREIARTSLSSAAKCRMISRLIAREKPESILELGTSLGIMSAYLASANASAHLHTIEANPDIMQHAQHMAGSMKLENISFHEGTFDAVLPELLQKINPIQFVLIDGDHKGSSLLRYYHLIKPSLSNDAIVMIDDIRWSADMYDGWKELLRDSDVTCSLDYFTFGLLFFRREFKENLRLQIRRWEIG